MPQRMNEPVLDGCELLTLDDFRDDRGLLQALELERCAGFTAKRVFLISVDENKPDIVRAEHATSSPQALFALAGSVCIDLDNGVGRQTLTLESGGAGIAIGAGVWRRLRNFSPNTLILALAAEPYDETEYFEVPRPELAGVKVASLARSGA